MITVDLPRAKCRILKDTDPESKGMEFGCKRVDGEYLVKASSIRPNPYYPDNEGPMISIVFIDIDSSHKYVAKKKQ